MLAERLSRGFAAPEVHPRQLVVIFDSKLDPPLRRLVPEVSSSIPTDRGGWCRITPPDLDAAEPFFRQIFVRGDVWFWIDELSMICPNPLRVPPSMALCYKQGAAANIGGLALAQSPKNVPILVKDQSVGVLMGQVGADYTDEAADLLHQERGWVRQQMAALQPYHFLYWTLDHGREHRLPDETWITLA